MAQGIIMLILKNPQSNFCGFFCYILAKIVKSLINVKSIEIKSKILYNVCDYGEVRRFG